MRLFVVTVIVLFSFASGSGQSRFDSAVVDELLAKLPASDEQGGYHENIGKAIKAVDRKYREITDTLYGYKSLKFTIFQTIYIETVDSVYFNPLTLGDSIETTSIIFNNKTLNSKVDSIAIRLPKKERRKLFEYLLKNFDNFSTNKKKLDAQPVRIKYIKWTEGDLVDVGIDIYGAHFLWSIDKKQNWDVVNVERLWVY